jgi:hypothetical protein
MLLLRSRDGPALRRRSVLSGRTDKREIAQSPPGASEAPPTASEALTGGSLMLETKMVASRQGYHSRDKPPFHRVPCVSDDRGDFVNVEALPGIG